MCYNTLAANSMIATLYYQLCKMFKTRLTTNFKHSAIMRVHGKTIEGTTNSLSAKLGCMEF